MHRRIVIFLVGPLLIISLWNPSDNVARAEIIDKIAAAVEGRIITLSDLQKERAIQTVLGDPPLTDHQLLKSMIDRTLLEKEMAQFPGLDVPEDEVDEAMKQITDFRGVTPTEIRNAITHKLQRLTYLFLRYRQFIVIRNDEIENEYKTNFVPEMQKKGLEVPELNQVSELIRNNLFQIKVGEELEVSLEALRARSNYEIF